MSGGLSLFFSVSTMCGSMARMCLLLVQTQVVKSVASFVSPSKCEHTKRTRAAHFICGRCVRRGSGVPMCSVFGPVGLGNIRTLLWCYLSTAV